MSKIKTVRAESVRIDNVSEQSAGKKIRLCVSNDDSLNSATDDAECAIVETIDPSTHSSRKDVYAEQNLNMAKEVTKQREMTQVKESRIQELMEENFKLSEYVVTIEEYTYRTKESLERAEKLNAELQLNNDRLWKLLKPLAKEYQNYKRQGKFVWALKMPQYL